MAAGGGGGEGEKRLHVAAGPHLVPSDSLAPFSPLVSPLLTDFYQISMAYAYFRAGKHEDAAVFDLFHRKPPFGGEFTLFAGLEEVVRFMQTFRITEEDVAYLRGVMGPGVDEGFFEWLLGLDCSEVRVFGVPEGTVVFPREPLLRLEGPLGVCQLLETTLLNLTNFASLMITNAARFRLAAGDHVRLLEFGVRRAQGSDGGMSATKYSYLGGFDATSNVAAGKLFGVPVRGTHAHAFVSSFTSLDELKERSLGSVEDCVARALELREELGFSGTNLGELAGFLSYAQSFPHAFLALVDTYDTLGSGVPNYCVVALVLLEAGFSPVGIRLDSGDLAHLSKEARKIFRSVDATKGTELAGSTIVASNDIHEAVLHSLADQGHEINSMGIGTHLVTCKAQPALGMVFKLVQIGGKPRIKISQEVSKITLPSAKRTYRLYGKDLVPIADLIIAEGDTPPQAGKRVLCRHPFDEKKRLGVTPSLVVPLANVVWKGRQFQDFAAKHPEANFKPDHAETTAPCGDAPGWRYAFPALEDIREYVKQQIKTLREDHLRALNPTPYKVSVSAELYDFVHSLWAKEVPVPEVS